jgi:DNA-binding MarR family transcriptional regulator
MSGWYWTLNRLVLMRAIGKRAPSPVWASLLTRELGTYIQTTSRVLSDLCAAGFIEEVDPRDGGSDRRTCYGITAMGRAVLSAVHQDLDRFEKDTDRDAVERVASALAECDGVAWPDAVQGFYLVRARAAIAALRER